MTRDVAVVHPETTLLAAVKLMASRRISGLPVTDQHGTLVGMMTEGDVLGWHEGFSEREARWFDLLAEGYELAPYFLREIQGHRRKIKAIMSTNPVTVSETAPAREVASLMHTQWHQARAGDARREAGRHRHPYRLGSRASPKA